MKTYIKKAKTPLYGLLALVLVCLFFTGCMELYQPPELPDQPDDPQPDNPLQDQYGYALELAAPDNFSVLSWSGKTIKMEWGEVDGAELYIIEHAQGHNESLLIWEEWDEIDDLEYTHDIIEEDETLESEHHDSKYWYRVTAINHTDMTMSDTTDHQHAMLFRAPANVQATRGASVDNVAISWEHADSNAASYEIWRSINEDRSDPEMVDTINGDETSYTHTITPEEQGITFYYWLVAVNKHSNESSHQSRHAPGHARKHGAPDAPANVRLAAGSGRGNSTGEIKIEWDAVTQEDGLSVYYEVYRYTNTNTTQTRIAQNIMATQYTDSAAISGEYNYYVVQSMADSPTGETLQGGTSTDAPEGYLLSPPAAVIAAQNPADGKIMVQWQRPSVGTPAEQSAYTYTVFANDTAVQSEVAHNNRVITSSAITINDTITVKTEYNGNTSIESDGVLPIPAVNVTASQHLYLEGEAANSNGVYPVQITWESQNNGSSVAYFKIERSDGSGFTTIGTVSGTDYTFIEPNSVARLVAKKYQYRVTPFNSSDEGIYSSEEATGWGALTHERYMIEYNKVMNTALGRLDYMFRDPMSKTTLGNGSGQQGEETRNGAISGTIYYKVAVALLPPGANITIKLTNYADFYIEDDPSKGVYMQLNGNSDTKANMSANGNMMGTMTVTGMYPGTVLYGTSTNNSPNANNGITIGGGEPNGGFYKITPVGFPSKNVQWNEPGIFRVYSFFNAATYPYLPTLGSVPYDDPYYTNGKFGKDTLSEPAATNNFNFMENARNAKLAVEQANPDYVNKRLPWLNW